MNNSGGARRVLFSRSLAVLVLMICSLAWLLSACGGDSGEDARRRALVVSLKAEVEKHHRETGVYPSLEAVSLADKDQLLSYFNSGVIKYYRDPTGRNFFVIKCVFSGGFKTPDEKYSISWNGIQYSNKRDQLIGVHADWKPDQDGFYIWDLH